MKSSNVNLLGLLLATTGGGLARVQLQIKDLSKKLDTGQLFTKTGLFLFGKRYEAVGLIRRRRTPDRQL